MPLEFVPFVVGPATKDEVARVAAHSQFNRLKVCPIVIGVAVSHQRYVCSGGADVVGLRAVVARLRARGGYAR
eukprot:571271-Pyramimonas_sp.AAC.1